MFASGMAAINAICTMYKSGDHVVCGHNLYGGVPRLFDQMLSGYGFEFTYVDTSDPKNVERAMRKNTRMVYVETPTNPLMALSDIAAIAKVCRRRKLNWSWTTLSCRLFPAANRAWRRHGRSLDDEIPQWSQRRPRRGGGLHYEKTKPSSLDSSRKQQGRFFLRLNAGWYLRGIKTLAVRMLQHDCNGRQVAEFLARHKKVKKVFYPGLKDHPQYELAKRQMSGFGSMITIETGSLANAARMLKRVRVCTLGESLGGVETLISHPATMTHAALGEKGRLPSASLMAWCASRSVLKTWRTSSAISIRHLPDQYGSDTLVRAAKSGAMNPRHPRGGISLRFLAAVCAAPGSAIG